MRGGDDDAAEGTGGDVYSSTYRTYRTQWGFSVGDLGSLVMGMGELQTRATELVRARQKQVFVPPSLLGAGRCEAWYGDL